MDHDVTRNRGKNMKKYIRYLYEPSYNERESIKDRLNRLGFYVLNAPEGLYVYAIADTDRSLIGWFKGLFKGEC